MQDTFFNHCRAWFDNYVEGYIKEAGVDSALVERKVSHTMRVLDHARNILPESGADETLAADIELAALLHDVARFPQLVQHKSYDDHVGYNHATEGARILKASDLLDPLPRDRRGVVLTTVRLHNRAVLPDLLAPVPRLALEVVRDADKLDAIHNNLLYLSPDGAHGKALKAGLTWDEEAVTPAVLDLVANRQLVPFKMIDWSNDYILFVCCWIYDLHFPYAWKQLRDTGNFAALLDRLPDSKAMLPIKKQLADDLDRIIAEHTA